MKIKLGQLADGQHIWLKAKDDIKLFDDEQLKGNRNWMAYFETAEAVYDADSNTVKILSSPTKEAIGLVMRMPVVVEFFEIIPPSGQVNPESRYDISQRTPSDNRNFIDPRIYPEPYENTLDYLTPTSKQTGYRSGQVTQADHASKGHAPENPRVRTLSRSQGTVLELSEEMAEAHPERVTEELRRAFKKLAFAPIRIWWMRPTMGDSPQYDITEEGNPRLYEMEIDWDMFREDLEYRNTVFESWSFLLGQGRYPYFVQK